MYFKDTSTGIYIISILILFLRNWLFNYRLELESIIGIAGTICVIAEINKLLIFHLILSNYANKSSGNRFKIIFANDYEDDWRYYIYNIYIIAQNNFSISNDNGNKNCILYYDYLLLCGGRWVFNYILSLRIAYILYFPIPL